MLIRKITVENVRSFLYTQELNFDGIISILIGPNGGGKTNLLDTLVLMLRKHLFATKYEDTHMINGERHSSLNNNSNINNITFDKHYLGTEKDQMVQLTIEIAKSDIDNMTIIKSEAELIKRELNRKFATNPWKDVADWDIDSICCDKQYTYTWKNGNLEEPIDTLARHFLQYLQIFEFDNNIRNELKKSPLQLPMIYLPVQRTGQGFQSQIALAHYNDTEIKKSLDITSSRHPTNIMNLAIGRLSQKYRALLEHSNVDVKEAFYGDQSIKSLTAVLKRLGYEWELFSSNIYTNEYDIQLKKQGITFTSGNASSGEKEVLTYIFAIYALNVRDAVIVVDEPELHLHPRWQKSLFEIFEILSKETGNQFILATHSPTFITPASIKYVSRIYSENQCSQIVRLSPSGLPSTKHLFNLVNSQNNERMFFAEQVVLVEGLSDLIFFEKVFNLLKSSHANIDSIPEIISVGGKGFFSSYSQLLSSFQVKFYIIADLDYIEQVGSEEVKKLFILNASEIKKDVIDNIKSMDGDKLVKDINEAIESGSWNEAMATWEYIKSKRKKIPTDLKESNKNILENFIDSKASDNLFILKNGALENYLPSGYKSKDLQNLITFLEDENFWNELPSNKKEIENIAHTILNPQT